MERSKAAKFATSVFYESFNDFDVYIEDTAPGYGKIFAAMFSRAMSSSIALDKVFPLGARVDVIAAAKARQAAGGARPAVYIVDGDLYMLAGEREALPGNVVVLPRYCIENFLLDEVAFVEIMDEEHCDLASEELKGRFDFEGWFDRSTASLCSLFRVFAAAHFLRSGVATVSRGYGSICNGQTGEVDSEKSKSIEDEILEGLKLYHGEGEVNRALAYVDAKVDPEKCFVRTYVSAKDFTLPLIVLKMKSVVPAKMPHVSLKMRMSKKCSVEPLSDVVRQISRVINMPHIIPSEAELDSRSA
ncbi:MULTISPECIES: DUF4435 domain-containing protein [unclassified Pseudomonas]|uniref:DUF4435 domain-containing protein n=1 Tax=unclassified Pseudomonas TaxID=196821 RepID=UPI000CD2F628|nr:MULTISPECIES: DUF4435 domain-containing protein [unclassified Pseudomonas]POA28612.1 hypothetical protein C1887_22575 [Pseudomonas sp. GW456-R21]POA64501.1 hypothetical protein C1884_21065 [Pseudomonas sp. GW460-R15]